MSTFKGKTVLITGGSRGIGREIALALAKQGANITIAAKTAEPHPKLPGTIHTVAQEIQEHGGQALPLQCDIRFEEQVQEIVAQTVERFGGLDILINNASAISLTPTTHTEMKRYDLMHGCNVRGTFLCSKTAIPFLQKSSNPHILNLSPPLNMNAKWFKEHLAYTMSKYGMSMCTLGLSEELRPLNIAVNSLWPRTTIATAAIQYNFPKEILSASRHATIVADAAMLVLSQKSSECTGNFFIDEDLLRSHGTEDFSNYAVNEKIPLMTDLYVE